MIYLPLRVIGLTGGIASGKSTVSDYLDKKHHCSILDADLLAREAVMPCSPFLEVIASRYGPNILTSTGALDREKLGQIIFANRTERQWLESLIHPFVREQLSQGRDRYRIQLKSSQSPMPPLVMVVPLLFESQMEDLVTESWVVACSLAQQHSRLRGRNHLSADEAEARIQSQWPLADKVRLASVVIDNSRDQAHLYHQVDLAMASSHPEESG